MRWVRVTGAGCRVRDNAHRAAMVILSVVALGGCMTQAKPATMLTAAQPGPYRLQPSDVIAIRFYRNPELNDEVTIRPDGHVSLQLIADVQAAGMTVEALTRELERRYDPELQDARLSVVVRTFAANRVFVSGEVGKQGVLDLGPGLTLYQAIQQAGGFLKTANRKQVVLIRRGPAGAGDGYAVDLRGVESGEQPQDDVQLAADDIVVVPRSIIANVNIFVEQYVRNNLPVQNVGLGFPF